MIKLYNEADCKKKEKEIKKEIIIIASIIICYLILFGFIVFLANANYKILFILLLSAITMVSFSSIYYIVDEKIIKQRIMLNHFKEIVGKESVTVLGRIVEIKEITTLARHESFVPIVIEEEKKETIYYVLPEYAYLFKESDEIMIKVHHRFIVEVKRN